MNVCTHPQKRNLRISSMSHQSMAAFYDISHPSENLEVIGGVASAVERRSMCLWPPSVYSIDSSNRFSHDSCLIK
jgi:hypothetical protein